MWEKPPWERCGTTRLAHSTHIFAALVTAILAPFTLPPIRAVSRVPSAPAPQAPCVCGHPEPRHDPREHTDADLRQPRTCEPLVHWVTICGWQFLFGRRKWSATHLLRCRYAANLARSQPALTAARKNGDRMRYWTARRRACLWSTTAAACDVISGVARLARSQPADASGCRVASIIRPCSRSIR